MCEFKQLSDFEQFWTTNAGGFFPEQNDVMFRGKNIFDELSHLSWMALFLFGITKRIPNDKQLRLFEGLWTLCTSYPDPRIWNNRIAALAGTAQSTATLGVSAATAASEAIIYGHQPLVAAMRFLLTTQEQLGNGQTLTQCLKEYLTLSRKGNKGRPSAGKNRQVAAIPGYGRPLVSRDERIEPLMKLAEELGFSEGPLVKLAFAVEREIMQSGYNLPMNAGALMAALAADQGLTPDQFKYFVILSFSTGIVLCGLDAAEKPPLAFFPMRCNRIHYHGKAPRLWDPVKA
jgi:citrate synthase